MTAPVVVADPRCPLPYYTYSLRGLADVGFRVRFRRLDCPLSRGMALQVGTTRLWLDAGDGSDLLPAPLEWADVAGKVNLVEPVDGVVPLGPVFGIRMWPLPKGYLMTPQLARGGMPVTDAIHALRFQGITRLGIDAYQPAVSDASYVFARSRRWNVERHRDVNAMRERFSEAVRTLPLEVEVSLVSDRIPLATYLDRVRRSAVVFNSPAVHQCLGWKLGEFLALGKAIVSTPLGRVLPAPLVHGTHVHYVDDDVDAMRDAVRLIVEDPVYRARLERGARAWYEQHLMPRRIGERLASAVGVTVPDVPGVADAR